MLAKLYPAVRSLRYHYKKNHPDNPKLAFLYPPPHFEDEDEEERKLVARGKRQVRQRRYKDAHKFDRAYYVRSALGIYKMRHPTEPRQFLPIAEVQFTPWVTMLVV